MGGRAHQTATAKTLISHRLEQTQMNNLSVDQRLLMIAICNGTNRSGVLSDYRRISDFEAGKHCAKIRICGNR